MSNAPVIVWFRQDLRVADNPALSAAAESGRQVLPIYILDDVSSGEWRMGAASRWWLHQSLKSLSESLNGQLRLFIGDARDVLPQLVEDTGATGVFWNRCYEPWRIKRDTSIKAKLEAGGLDVRSHNGSLLFEPHTVMKADGTPYKVFTPFYRKGCLAGQPELPPPLGVPDVQTYEGDVAAASLDELELIPSITWYEEIDETWQPGEDGGHSRLEEFLGEGLRNYKQDRNRPDRNNVSRLSPHLHFGEVSPLQVWHAARQAEAMYGLETDVDHFLSEIGWREFSNNLLFHWPELTRKNLQPKFDKFPWREDGESLERWQRGMTGYPIVDAGMRELWRTGYMHNRVRMIVGSFLVKNLLLHWHHGEDWFWDTLVDADLANNSASWQWIAGCGADAAPYFRIFNPVLQGKKFDPDGLYVRKYVPELANVDTKYLHNPWEAPSEMLQAAGVELGIDYPAPIVDLKASRERALEAFRSLS